MKSILKYGILSLMVLGLGACGDKTKDSDKNVTIQETGTLTNGKYYLGSASVEYFGNNGERLNTVTLQVTGEYSWSMTSLGASKYQLTATGNAKLLSNNQIAYEFICSGARDVAHFELTPSNAVSSLRLIESGCPQGLNAQGATQMSIDPISASTFIFTNVEIANGYRATSTYTFNKR